MSTETREERLARRITELSATDPQFAAAIPDEAVTAAVDEPGLPLPQIVQTVLQGYSDRPALGERAVEFVADPATGRTTARLLPRFDTITYGQLWDRVRATAAAWHEAGVTAGDRVAILGFTSADYTAIDTALGQLGAVSVPLQTSSSPAALAPIVVETEPGSSPRASTTCPTQSNSRSPRMPRPSWWCSTTTPRSTTIGMPWSRLASDWTPRAWSYRSSHWPNSSSRAANCRRRPRRRSTSPTRWLC